MAIVCFLPDAGHVLPLLRLGRLLQTLAPSRVTCFLTGNFAAAARDHGFELREILAGAARWPDDLAVTLAGKSLFYNAFSGYTEMSDRYWMPLRDSASQELPTVVSALRDLEPHLLICDDHVFSDWYERLAASCGARLLVNRSEGTLRWMQRPYVRTYGFNSRAEVIQRLVEMLGRLSELWFRCWRRVRHPERSGKVRQLRVATDTRTAKAFEDCGASRVVTTFVSSGLAALEPLPESRGDEPAPGGHQVILAPTIGLEQPELPPELQDWVARQAKGSIVYVSFGTMVALSEEVCAELVRGLIDSRATVIWSLPQSQHSMLLKHPLPSHFRIEKFVAQPALLASGQVGCFITHGGAGSTQEAVAFGTPVLCVPFMWDQPYNGSLLVRMGMGRMLSKHQLTRRRICHEIRTLLDDRKYAAAAAEQARAIRELQASRGYEESLHALFAETP